MRTCLICDVSVDDNRDFCTPCYQKKIWEIEEVVSQKEGPSSSGKEIREAQANNPLEEDVTH